MLLLALTIQLMSVVAAPAQRPAQQPFKYPLSNGFPNLGPADPAVAQIQQQAHGTLPNRASAMVISPESALVWEVIGFNALFEVAFFSSLLKNLTHSGPSLVLDAAERQGVVDAITVIQAQEELNALGANAILGGAGRSPVEPCEYIFPSSTLNEALTFAITFTDLTIGMLQFASSTFGTEGDLQFLPLVGAIIGQKGERNGFFRERTGKSPTALPLLTEIGDPIFTRSFLQQMVTYPGSCPSDQNAGLPILPSLTVLTKNIQSTTKTIKYSFTNATLPDPTNISLAYINQLNHPVSVPLQSISVSKNTITFTADFPWALNLLNGLTIATIVNGHGPFDAPSDAAAAALFGPGLLEVN